MPKPIHISAFDLDHTLLTANSSFKFGTYLYKQKYFSPFKMLYLVGTYGLHRAGFLTITQVHHYIFKKLFKAKSKAEIQSHVDAFLEKYLDQLLYTPAIETFRKAKESGHYTLILSSSPDFLVKPIAIRLGFTSWNSTYYEIDKEQRFCQISNLLQGEQKANYLDQLRKSLNVPKERTAAYSDSHLDLPFLHAAGIPVAVNPNKKLRSLSQQNKWPII